ncbi:uncharacterized protein TNCT_87521 [Trichonephila clavata]|uniref:Uncharacterized protein n=1 Tax=Trichonephila clavata TaxID=2740835 RepID=A0A8X6FC84_TRICU|nr:uncharacterized protein TNCT_87521 [Trichonephila clavata]
MLGKNVFPLDKYLSYLKQFETKIRAQQTDDVIRAELPDQEVYLELFVKTHMVHGPCGSYNPRSPCMKNGICSKRFLKPFNAETVTGEDGYPFYRRRSPENGLFHFHQYCRALLEIISTLDFVVVLNQ